jgi:hypothetical protein
MTIPIKQETVFEVDYAADRKILETLKASDDLEDLITACLMDEEVGDFGYWAGPAREKAKDVIKLINNRGKQKK